MIRALKLAATFAALALGLAAYAGPKQMEPATSAPPVPSAELAVVEIMRPSNYGGAIRAAVFDATDSEPKLLGILTPKMKIVAVVPPGKRLFMIIGENADFMEADLTAGKTYHAIAIARMGAWKARFSLIPLKRTPEEVEFTLNGPKMKEWSRVCKYVTMTPVATQWYTEHRPSVLEKLKSYSAKWAEVSDATKKGKTLQPEDGE